MVFLDLLLGSIEMNFKGNKTVKASNKIKGLQSGKVQDYAFSFVMGAVIIAIVFIYLWTN